VYRCRIVTESTAAKSKGSKSPGRRLVLILGWSLFGAALVAFAFILYSHTCTKAGTNVICDALAVNPPWTLLTSLGSAPALMLLWYWRTVHKDTDIDQKKEELEARKQDIQQRDAELAITKVQIQIARDAAERQHALALREERSKRFVEAVRLLADRKIEARLGGVYSLESLATDAEEERKRTVETLCAFLRTHGRAWESKFNVPPSGWTQPEDIQAALAVVCRMPNIGPLDLRRAHLSNIGVDGVTSNLEGVCLDDASLSGVDFAKVKLRGAQFRNADLRDALFAQSDLRNADLSKAIVGDCLFLNADMRGARLWGVDLSEANLDDARLEGAMYDDDTKLPGEFSADERGMVKIGEFE